MKLYEDTQFGSELDLFIEQQMALGKDTSQIVSLFESQLNEKKAEGEKVQGIIDSYEEENRRIISGNSQSQIATMMKIESIMKENAESAGGAFKGEKVPFPAIKDIRKYSSKKD